MSVKDAGRSTQWCFFDIDGVLVYECGVAYAGYWLQLEALRTGKIPDDYTKFLEIPDNIKLQIDTFRPHVKGLHFRRKLEKMHEFLTKAGESITDLSALDFVALVKATMKVQQSYIQRHFPPDKYCVSGAKDLLLSLSKRYSICTLTANDFEQTSWILQYVGLSSYFTELLCYHADNPGLQTKEDLLKDFQSRHPSVDFSQCVVLGDGLPDIQAGAAMGCFTVGVYGTPNDRAKLATANLLVDVGNYSSIPAHLLARKSIANRGPPMLILRSCGGPCNPDDIGVIEFSCQQEIAPMELSVCVIWDVAYNELETPLKNVHKNTKECPEAIYSVKIPLASVPRDILTNIGMVILRNGETTVHRQLFRVAYVSESAVALQPL